MSPFEVSKSEEEKGWDHPDFAVKASAAVDVSANPLASEDLLDWAQSEGLQPIFLAKVKVLNDALQEAGMGKYQWKLFFSAGMGWFSDNAWLQLIAILQPAIAAQEEFPSYPDIRLSTLALYMGLLVGAIFWGFSADVIGRRFAWNLTIFIGAIFGAAAGASPNFTVLGVMLAFMAFGVGGNLPVDGALFLEFLPASHQYLLTMLSVFWAIGQVVACLIAWVFLAHWSCDPSGKLAGTPGFICDNSNNPGWRYAFYTTGGVMFVLALLRFFALPLDESPKFLVSVGRDKEAVAVIRKIAKMNGRDCRLTVADLHDAALPYFRFDGDGDQVTTKFSTLDLVKQSGGKFKSDKLKALFRTRRLVVSTSLIIFIYGALGLAYPMFFAFLGAYLSMRNSEIGNMSKASIYSTYAYQAASGVIGSFLAAALVQWARGGRRFAMSLFTVLSGIFLFALTAARTTTEINALTCLVSLFANAFYGVLWGYSPEVFPTPSRGTGDALASAASRLTGLFAPIIVVYSPASLSPNAPVYASAAIFIVTGLTMCALPIETYGHAAL